MTEKVIVLVKGSTTAILQGEIHTGTDTTEEEEEAEATVGVGVAVGVRKESGTEAGAGLEAEVVIFKSLSFVLENALSVFYPNL